MWNRKDIKKKGFKAFKNNYFRCLLVAIVFGLFVGGESIANFNYNPGEDIEEILEVKDKYITVDSDITDGKTALEEKLDTLDSDLTDGAQAIEEGMDSLDSDLTDGFNQLKDNIQKDSDDMDDATVVMIILFVVFIAMAFIFIVAFLIEAFIANPFEIGCNNFFYKNLNEKADLGLMMSGYSDNFGNKVKTMFLRDIYLVLWGMLFIIPGIVKSYEYRMIPYLLATNPELSTKEIFAKSKEIMTGNKWRAFVFDLSFIGWELLNVITFGILGLFFLNPYKCSAKAALFEELSGNQAQTKKEEDFEIYTEI